MLSESPDKPSKWLEATAAIILALASLLTAWSSYEATQWTRTQAITGNKVVAKLVESTRQSTEGGQDTLADVIIFTNWLGAVSAENQPLADFYRSRFRDEFKPAFEAWVALEPLKNPDAPSSPFAMPEYAPASRQKASDLQAEAGELQQEVQIAAHNAASYVRNTLFLALALFLVGISRMFPARNIRLALEVLAIALLLLGIFNIVTSPIA